MHSDVGQSEIAQCFMFPSAVAYRIGSLCQNVL